MFCLIDESPDNEYTNRSRHIYHRRGGYGDLVCYLGSQGDYRLSFPVVEGEIKRCTNLIIKRELECSS